LAQNDEAPVLDVVNRVKHRVKAEEAEMTAALADPILTAVDRCDRCGAQAYVRVVLEASGGELQFCAHHARAVESTLRPLASVWHDETSRLTDPVALAED
jgi:hypothetical protein